MDKKLAVCTIYIFLDLIIFESIKAMAADLNQISSSHLKITKNCKVQWQYLKSLQNCTLSLNFHADILNCGDIAERGLIQRIYCGRLWKSKLFADYGSL